MNLDTKTVPKGKTRRPTLKLRVITDTRDTLEATDPEDMVYRLYCKYNGIVRKDDRNGVPYGSIQSWVADVSARANAVAEREERNVIFHQVPPIAWLVDMLSAGYLHTLEYVATTEARSNPSAGIWKKEA